jgi:hypothetical protein
MRRSWRTGVAFACAVAQRFAKLVGILRPGWIRSRSISPAIDSRRSPLNASSTLDGRTEFTRSAGRPRRTRPNAKQCIWLDIETLMRERILVPYAKSCGGIAWRDNITCEYFPDDCMETVNSARDYVCWVGFAADMCEPALAGIRLRYRTCDRATRRQRVADHRVGLARIGNAWWFIDNGRWSKRLCLPLGADRFRPPDVWNIRYRVPSPRHEPQPPSQNVPARQPGNGSHSPPANMEPIGRHPEKPAVRSNAETDQQQANEARSLCTNALAINDRDPAPGTAAAGGDEVLAPGEGRPGARLYLPPRKCPPSLPEPPPPTGNLASEKGRHGSQCRQKLRDRLCRAATLAGAHRLTRSGARTCPYLAAYAPSGALETNVRIGPAVHGGAEQFGPPGPVV